MAQTPIEHPVAAGPVDVALIGNPNTGKTSIFNALTGLRQKIGNYPGVTVEKKTGTMIGPHDEKILLHDLPGLYSLNPKSIDEKIARDVLLGESDEDGDIKLIIVVADAANLSRNLYLVTQIIDLDIPVIVALNMMDGAEAVGVHIDVEALSERLLVPVIPVIATKGMGIDRLRETILSTLDRPAEADEKSTIQLDEPVDAAISPLVSWL